MRGTSDSLAIGLVIRFVPDVQQRYRAIAKRTAHADWKLRLHTVIAPMVIGTLQERRSYRQCDRRAKYPHRQTKRREIWKCRLGRWCWIALFTAIIVVLGLIPPIMLTFIPVPIHAQSMGVLLAGVVLGARGVRCRSCF